MYSNPRNSYVRKRLCSTHLQVEGLGCPASSLCAGVAWAPAQ